MLKSGQGSFSISDDKSGADQCESISIVMSVVSSGS